MSNPKITYDKNLFLKGSLSGKYEANPINSYFEDSKIDLIETIIKDVTYCKDYESLLCDKDSLEYSALNNVDILLREDKSLINYKFKEDIFDVKIEGVRLSNQIKDGSTTFGSIHGNAKFSLYKPETFQINTFTKPNEDFEIVFPDLEKKKKWKKIKKLLKYLFFSFFSIAIIILLIYLVSLVDFEKTKDDIGNFVDDRVSEVQNKVKDFTSKTILLNKKGVHNYANITIGNIKQEFMLDTGASITTVSADFIKKLLRSGYLKPEIHFIQFTEFAIANGDKVNGEIWRVPKIKLGSITIYDVQIAVISDENGPFLLGQSTLRKLGDYAIFPEKSKIVIYN